VNSLPKRLFFHALFLTISLCLGALGAELTLRVRTESGLRGAVGSFSDLEAPTASEREDLPLIADPVLSFRYNPKVDDVNSLGLRNPEIELEKPLGKKRIVILGDSVTVLTYGEPNTPEGLIAQLRNRIGERGEVINGAVSGYTIYQQRLMLEHELLRFKPDIVVVQHTLNDNQEFLHRYDESARLLLTEEARRAYAIQGDGPLDWLAQHSYLALRVRVVWMALQKSDEKYPWDRYPGFPKSWRDESWEFVAEQLGVIRDLSDSVGARVVVLSVPFGPQYEQPLLSQERAYVTKPQRKMRHVCNELGIPLIDLFPLFEPEGGAELFYDFVHMVPEGHQLAAESLARNLEELGWLDATSSDAVSASESPAAIKPVG